MPLTCTTCACALVRKQTKFCSAACKNADTNHRHQVYENQQARGLARKRMFVDERGGGCERCGYDRNLAALCFHHEGDKEFGVTAREMSNNKLELLRAEVAKCILLCHNCHMEEHHPDLTVRATEKAPGGVPGP